MKHEVYPVFRRCNRGFTTWKRAVRTVITYPSRNTSRNTGITPYSVALTAIGPRMTRACCLHAPSNPFLRSYLAVNTVYCVSYGIKQPISRV